MDDDLLRAVRGMLEAAGESLERARLLRQDWQRLYADKVDFFRSGPPDRAALRRTVGRKISGKTGKMLPSLFLMPTQLKAGRYISGA